jgi:hypothetical protein
MRRKRQSLYKGKCFLSNEREREKERESFLKHFPFSLLFAQNTSKIYKVLLDKARWKI